MTQTTIETSNDSLPDLTIAGATQYHTPPNGETPDVFSQPYPLSNLEQRLRLDFLRGGIKQGYEYSEITIKDAYNAESNTLSTVQALKEALEDAREPYLRASLQDAIADIESIGSERNAWYYNHVPQARDTAFKNALRMLYDETAIESIIGSSIDSFSNKHVQQESIREAFATTGWTQPELFVGRIIVPDDHDEPSRWSPDLVIAESELDNVAPPSVFGVELPAPLMVCVSDSGSQYALVPHSGTIECGGPFAQADHSAHNVLCKHVMAGILEAAHSDSLLLPHHGGIEVPERCRRLIAPDILVEHTSLTPTDE